MILIMIIIIIMTGGDDDDDGVAFVEVNVVGGGGGMHVVWYSLLEETRKLEILFFLASVLLRILVDRQGKKRVKKGVDDFFVYKMHIDIYILHLLQIIIDRQLITFKSSPVEATMKIFNVH